MQSTTATSQRPTTSITTASSGPGEWIHNRHVGSPAKRCSRSPWPQVAAGERKQAQTRQKSAVGSGTAVESTAL